MQRAGASFGRETETASEQAGATHARLHRWRVGRYGRYGALLLILIATYLLSAFLAGRWIALGNLVLYTAVGMIALRNSAFRRGTIRRIVGCGLVISAATIVISAVLGGTLGRESAAIWTSILLLLTIALIVHQILTSPAVTEQSVYAALSAYLMIGLMFAAIYSATYYLKHMTFFAPGQLHGAATPATFQYFSFTTLTTLGYGDLTAGYSGDRAVATVEAVVGQIFLVTLVAKLVATYRTGSRRENSDSGREE
ncbi:MAG TPA: potassium channel family protein [Anaerolineae bacterium]